MYDGDTLLTLLESFIPDLLFLDLNMPCKNGVECIKAIRENRAYDGLPIIVFTISSQDNAVQTAYGFGANLFFTKPSDYVSLLNSLGKILAMDWSNPKNITEGYFENDKYSPFVL